MDPPLSPNSTKTKSTTKEVGQGDHGPCDGAGDGYYESKSKLDDKVIKNEEKGGGDRSVTPIPEITVTSEEVTKSKTDDGHEKECEVVANENEDGKPNLSTIRYRHINYSTIGFRAAICAITYPIDYARTLMQIGYEPFEPSLGITLFGRPCLLFMNNFQYIKYIKSIDGLLGCYRGLLPKLVQNSLYYLTYSIVNTRLKQLLPPSSATSILKITRTGGGRLRLRFQPSQENGGNGNVELVLTPSEGASDIDDENSDSLELELEETDDEDCNSHSNALNDDDEDEGDSTTCSNFTNYAKSLIRDLFSRLSGIVISYPFQLIAVRTIAEFVGREKVYSGFINGITQVYKESGICGFYRGLVPKICGETLHVILVGTATYLIQTQIVSDEGRACLNISMSVLITALTYPFQVVSQTMAVSSASTLKIGNPPHMPYFANWLDCWKSLASINQLRRGSSYFFRYYSGPVDKLAAGGRLVPHSSILFGPAHYPICYGR